MASRCQIQLPDYNNTRIFKLNGFRLILLSAFCFLFSSGFSKPNLQKRTDYISPPEQIKYLSFGNSIQYADSFWLRAIQDFEFCDSPVNEKECHGKSWLFQIIDTVVNLDQNFFEAHYYGALALTIMVNDFEGASAIFDKGVKQFPDNWMILYAAGYHALVEEKNKVKASKLYYQAGIKGAPDWVAMMAGKLAADGGDIDYATKILEGMIEMNQKAAYIDRLKEKLEEKKAVLNH